MENAGGKERWVDDYPVEWSITYKSAARAFELVLATLTRPSIEESSRPSLHRLALNSYNLSIERLINQNEKPPLFVLPGTIALPPNQPSGNNGRVWQAAIERIIRQAAEDNFNITTGYRLDLDDGTSVFVAEEQLLQVVLAR